jgi:hypothetical protein
MAPAMADTVAVVAATRQLWYRAQGVVALRRNRLGDAVRFLQQAMAFHPDTTAPATRAPLQIELGLALAARGDRAQAVATLQTAVGALRAAGHDVTRLERAAQRTLGQLQRTASPL